MFGRNALVMAIALAAAALSCGPHDEPVNAAGGPRHGLSREAVDRAVTARQRSFGACYQAARLGDGTTGGTLALAWTIEPDGRVTDVQIVSSTLASPTLADCVLGAARALRFPAAHARTRVGHYPFVFDETSPPIASERP